MENASKALIIAGAILISILIIAIGMYIYTSSTGSINEAISQMDTQEVEAFNSQWTNYEGTQTGTQVKAMIQKMIAQANTYQDEPEKVVAINSTATGATASTAYMETPDSTVSNTSGNITDYISTLNDLYTDIRPKRNYEVSFDFAGQPIIRIINIADH